MASDRKGRGYAAVKCILLCTTFLLMVSQAMSAVAGCAPNKARREVGIKNSCYAAGASPDCESGWVDKVGDEGCFLLSVRKQCERDVCDECSFGRYGVKQTVNNDPFGTATFIVECKPCGTINNCAAGQVSCTSASANACGFCEGGHFKERADSTNPSDQCKPCSSITFCEGSISCTDSTDQTCPACSSGYYLTTDKKACVKCETGCE
eukprot:3089929-Rhodomonas_salina.1